MKVLVVGSGGREHALCWKFRQSAKVTALYCANGNPGTALVAQNVPIAVHQIEELANFVDKNRIDLTVVGPEYPLSLGIVNLFRSRNLRIFGPTQQGARLESSKAFAKEVMIAAGVTTAGYQRFTDYNTALEHLRKGLDSIVLKADGLASGKGVFVCHSKKEAEYSLKLLFEEFKAGTVIIEDFLQGHEASFIVATDGQRIIPLATSHDYKRVGDGDRGLNTGGMGSVSPTARLTPQQSGTVIKEVIQPVINEMQKRGEPFCGFLYAGLMIEPNGKINVLEFSTRLGDPECQSIVRRMSSDLFEILWELTEVSHSKPIEVQWRNDSAICVVLASEGYPEKPSQGDMISGINLAEALNNIVVFHAGTKLDGDRLLTAGGRVLNVTAVATDAEQARAQVYRACDMIQFRGGHFRRDIGL